MTKDPYLGTLDRMEPDITAIDASAFYASAAISLKRQADALEKIAAVAEFVYNETHNPQSFAQAIVDLAIHLKVAGIDRVMGDD